MDIVTIALIVLFVLLLSGFGYGYYSVPAGGPGPAAWVNPLGVLAAIVLIALVVMLLTGWRFGLQVAPPP